MTTGDQFYFETYIEEKKIIQLNWYFQLFLKKMF